MKTTHYKTDNRLLLGIALAVFPFLWLVPCIPEGKDEAFAPIVMLSEWTVHIPGGQTSHAEVSGTGSLLLWFTFFAGTIAVIIAWLPQCIIVIIRNKRHKTAGQRI